MKWYSGSFDFFECELHNLELLHLLLYFIPQHLVDKNMGQEDFPPIFFSQVLILNSSLRNFVKIQLSCLVLIDQLQLFINHSL